MKKFNTIFLFVLSILLLTASFVYADSEYIEGEVIVVLRDNATVSPTNKLQKQSERIADATNIYVKNIAGDAGASPAKTYQALSRSGHGIVALLKSESKTTDELIADLRDNPDVISVSPNRNIYAMSTIPDDEKFDSLWGLEMINAPVAWDITNGDGDSYVAVLDSGISADHPDLAGNVDTDYSRNFTNENAENNTSDGLGHGTHVSGIIGAVGNNGTGVSGVNWNTKIIMLKVLKENGTGQLDWTIDAIDYLLTLLESGLRIPAINISYGGYDSTTPDKYVESPEWLTFKKLDDTNKTVIVVAAGNDGFEVGVPALYKATGSGNKTFVNVGDVGYPESMTGINNMIVVGSLGPTKEASNFSNWSSKYVHVAAPGGDSKINGYDTILSTFLSNSYKSLEGTSMATPFVTGSIALLASSESHKNLNASQLKEHLLNTSNGAINPNSAALTIDPPKTGQPIKPQAASDTKISKYGLIDIGKAVKTSYDDSFVQVTGIKLIAPQITLPVGKSMFIATEIEPSNASDKTLEWSSSNDSVATVDSSGYINTLSTGFAIISVSSISSGAKETIRIEVTSKEVENNNMPSKEISGGGCDAGTRFGIIVFLVLMAMIPRQRLKTLKLRISSKMSLIVLVFLITLASIALFFWLSNMSVAEARYLLPESYPGYDTSLPPLKNFEEGVGNIKWNTPSSVLDEDCVPIENPHEYLGLSIFEKRSGALTFGGTTLEFIQYFFIDNRFSGVLFKAQNEENAEILNKYVHALFGSPYRLLDSSEGIVEWWEGGLMYATFINGELNICRRN
jgi:subtilisin family serine protease